MSFTSNLFLTVLLPVTFGFVLLFRKNLTCQNVFLLLINITTLLFFGLSGIILLAVMCVLDYFFIRLIQRNNPSRSATFLFVFALLLNIAPLLLFKYTGFIFETVNSLFGTALLQPQWIVPVGISFFTFQALSLLSDVKTGKITYRPKLFEIVFYLTFFTTITSGPIVRFDLIHSQLSSRKIEAENINNGLTRLVIGLGKKVLLANYLAIYVEDVFSYTESYSLSVPAYWLGSIAFTLQLYLDFSGYSDMAIGISKIIGFKIPENFDYPYIAKNIGDFWRRWHISLSQWFRDYIYIPLGGNRVGVPRHIFNLFVVWLLTGIWHGANWTFIAWGLMYFVLLVFEKYVPKAALFLKTHFIGHLYTLFFVNLLWIFFRAPSINAACVFVARMFGVGSIGTPVEPATVQIIPFLIIAAICCTTVIKRIASLKENRVIKVLKPIALCCVLVLSIFAISNSSVTPFIYGNF